MKFFQGDRCNATLGGGRSIQLSYWCIRLCILPKFFLSVKKIRHFFCFEKHILSGSVFGRHCARADCRPGRKVKPCTAVTTPTPIWTIWSLKKETAAPASADSPSISACLSLFDGARHFSFSYWTPIKIFKKDFNCLKGKEFIWDLFCDFFPYKSQNRQRH